MLFVDVHHDMFYGPDGNNYLSASWSFIHEFYLNILAINLKLNNKTYGSEHTSENLEDRFKADYCFDFTNNTRTIVSDTTNSATEVARYFSEYSEQVNCDIHRLNIAMKYGFGLLENTRSTIAVDDNGIRIKQIN